MSRFADPAAAARWSVFAARLDAALRQLPADQRGDLKAEIEGHALDAYAATDGADEAARLDAALVRLGDPALFLQPLLTDQLVAAGTRGVHPLTLMRGLGAMVAEGGRAALVGLGFVFLYVCLAVFAAMALLKPFMPDRLGLFRSPDGQIDFGFVSDSAGSTDLIGLWAMPVGLALALVTWWLLGRLLRIARRVTR